VASPQFNEIVASLRERLAEIDAQLATFETLQSERSRVAAAIEALEGGGPSNSASPRKSSPRRSQAGNSRRGRARRGTTQNAVLGYLAENPGSSASAIADALGLKRNSTSTRLTQMAKAGVIVKSEGRGYEVPSGGSTVSALDAP
jgi:biotin operon repressor